MSQKFRFKRKSYGRGRTPASWQGWLCMIIYIIGMFLILDGIVMKLNTGILINSSDMWMSFLPQTFVLVGILLFICYKKGEFPRRQWGNKEIKRQK